MNASEFAIVGYAAPNINMQLEYFRRFQLQGQERYYAKRGEKHERAASRANVKSPVTIGVAGLLNAAAGIIGA